MTQPNPASYHTHLPTHQYNSTTPPSYTTNVTPSIQSNVQYNQQQQQAPQQYINAQPGTIIRSGKKPWRGMLYIMSCHVMYLVQ